MDGYMEIDTVNGTAITVKTPTYNKNDTNIWEFDMISMNWNVISDEIVSSNTNTKVKIIRLE